MDEIETLTRIVAFFLGILVLLILAVHYHIYLLQKLMEKRGSEKE